MIESKSKEVPSGTESAEWLKLSARIAYRSWISARRADFMEDIQKERELWQEESKMYRAQVRTALRQLHREGIVIKYLSENSVEIDDAWRAATARIAWRLWLSERRADHAADPESEKRVWSEISPFYRLHVREAFKELAQKDMIGFDFIPSREA